MSSEKLARSWTISCTTQRRDSIDSAATLLAGRIGPGRTAGRLGAASPIGEVSRKGNKILKQAMSKAGRLY